MLPKSSKNCLLAACVLLVCCPFTLKAQQQSMSIPLWPKGAPGYENRRDIPEQAKDYWVKNIQNPSLVVFLPPKEKATGAGVVICPGGGHSLLVYTAEGLDPAAFLNHLGIAAIVLKYRLFREPESPYHYQKEVREDILRAMRLVRSHAGDWNIDTARLGVMGFSAGGEVAALVAYAPGTGDPVAADPVDRLPARPNFQILIYPGPLGVPDSIPANAPPAFLLAANDDPCCAVPTLSLLEKYRHSGAPVEAHILSQGGHGFNMGYRSKINAVKNWPALLTDWLKDNILSTTAAPGKPEEKP